MPVELHAVIIGGGPAGAAAALTLRRRPDIRVTLIEASDYTLARAGEALSPGTRSLLEYLGVWETVRDTSHGLQTWANEAAWGSGDLGSLDYINTIHGPGWGLDRCWFDKMLVQMAAAQGTEVLTGHRAVSLYPNEERWRIELDDKTLTADYVIDAAGRPARFARRFGAERKVHDQMVGVGATLIQREYATQRRVICIEAVRDGWWYAAPLPSGHVSVVFMSDADIVHTERYADSETWLTSLFSTKHIASLVSSKKSTISPRIFPAFSAHCRSNQARIIAAGDAAACYDPLSSSGIPNALASGIQAARVVADDWFGKGVLRSAYEAAVSADFNAYLTARTRYYSQEQRWPEAPFWRRRSATIKLMPTDMMQAGTRGSTPHVPVWIASRILALAESPIQAATLIKKVQALSATLPDQRIILAAQDLLVSA